MKVVVFTWLEGASVVEGLAEVGRHLLAVQRGLAHAFSLAGRVLKLKQNWIINRMLSYALSV